jgi:hypothetical protein
MATMGIGEAVEQIRMGYRVRRSGWNGKGMWLTLVEGQGREPRELAAAKAVGSGWGDMHMKDYVVMRTADGEFVPWLCSQTDLLARDWEVAY